ncbi:MAG: CoA transferase [Acidimicrobiia bacterium]|nr:CoA transferase [Acidimicrobiia bacterium]
MAAPLAGIRVLELTSWMAAPSAAAVLSDLGAQVVKVEPLKGDAARGMGRAPKNAPGLDASFHFDNRGKRSIAVAMDRPEGAELVRKLARECQVLVTNLLPHRQSRFGLDAPSLFADNPTLVHATLTGYGTTGPEAWRPGYDVTAFFGRGAVTAASIVPGSEPPAPRPAQGDHAVALALVTAILAALRLVDQTGQGQAVETSLFHTAAWTMATDLAPTLVDRYQPKARGRRDGLAALAGRYPCKDDRWIILNMPEPHWWPKFCQAIGKAEWTDDERYASPKARFDNMAALVDALDDVFRTRTQHEWGEAFDLAGLIWGPAQQVFELVDDPQARAAGFFAPIEAADGTTFDTVTVPFKIAGTDVLPQGPAPELGQHTREVLSELGLPEAEIDKLSADQVVA